MKTVTLTAHGAQRLLERENLTYKKAMNFADRAWRKGRTVEDFDGRVREKLERIEARRGGCTVRVFANDCFLFSEDAVLITAYSFDTAVQRPRREWLDDDECWVA